MNNETFYAECAALLGADHEGQPFPYYRRTRWNNRKPGQGRFPGCGIIRIFGEQVHVALNKPPMHAIFNSKSDALKAIEDAIKIA